MQNGYTIAHDPTGKPTFLHGAIPGEEVSYRITRAASGHHFAIATKILKASPERIEIDCVAFPSCGGCSFRQISYEEENRVKQALLKEFPLFRTLQEEDNLQWVTGPDIGYRNHAQIHFDGRNRGFLGQHSNQIEPLPEKGCHHIPAELNEVIRDYPFPAPGRFPFRYQNGEIITPDRIQSGEKVVYPISRENLPGKLQWNFASNSFFQSNRHLIAPWLATIRSWIPAGKPDAVDLFAGSGLISGSNADLLGNILAIESHDTALSMAKHNFKKYSISGRVESSDLYRNPPALNAASLLIVNPPRAGLNRMLQNTISRSSISTLIYSSCNPHTLHRDVVALIRDGNFTIDRAVFFDFFPRTPHGELVLRLVRA